MRRSIGSCRPGTAGASACLTSCSTADQRRGDARRMISVIAITLDSRSRSPRSRGEVARIWRQLRPGEAGLDFSSENGRRLRIPPPQVVLSLNAALPPDFRNACRSLAHRSGVACPCKRSPARPAFDFCNHPGSIVAHSAHPRPLTRLNLIRRVLATPVCRSADIAARPEAEVRGAQHTTVRTALSPAGRSAPCSCCRQSGSAAPARVDRSSREPT
jgi:hypothetical protein